MNTRLSVSAASNWVGLALNVSIGLITTPIIVSRVGTSAYGVWVLAIGFIGYYGILEIGVRASLIRFIGYHDQRGEHDAVAGVASSSLALFSF